LTLLCDPIISSPTSAAISPPPLFARAINAASFAITDANPKDGSMANTKSAKKATRKIARRTEVNKARRSRMRTSLRQVEDAIASGNKAAATAALVAAEPPLMRAARTGIIHKKSASRKVSRLTHRIAKLAD
jgi:small subunit ribosomal protein S20